MSLIVVFMITLPWSNNTPKKGQVLRNGVVSMGRCNTCLQSTRWGLKSQSLSRTLI
jgi:hypothetical protein